VTTSRPDSAIELSIVMPCLNEADTLTVCIRAVASRRAAGLSCVAPCPRCIDGSVVHFSSPSRDTGSGRPCMTSIVGCAVSRWGVVWQWSAAFSPLDFLRALRWAIAASTLTALGLQTILASLFISILGLQHR
jgi:hypothetical protein